MTWRFSTIKPPYLRTVKHRTKIAIDHSYGVAFSSHMLSAAQQM